jgi:outer membrane biosynthesis protein TonB
LPPFPSTDIKLPPIGDLSDLPFPPPLDSLDPDTSAKTPATKPTPSKPPTKPPETETPKAPPPETKKPETPPREIAAKRQQNLNKNLRSLSGSLQKQEAGTTDEDARKNYVAWLNEIKDIKPEQLEIEGTYPRDACIRKLEGTSVYGIVVDAKGTVVAADLIKGAEYPLFNEQAIKDISDRQIENKTDKPKPLQITINYEYDSEICPSLTLPSLRRDKPSQPKPQPKAPEKPPAATETPPVKPQTTPEKPPAVTETPPVKPQPKAPEKPPAATETPPAEPEKPSLRDRLRNSPLLPDARLQKTIEEN